MIQEKYNRRIYDEGTEAAIREFSHLRTNAFSPVHISSSDKVLIFKPESTAIVEWLESVADSVVVASDNLSDIDETFDIIISIATVTETASTLKKYLKDGGRLIYVLPEKPMGVDLVKKLLTEAQMKVDETYRLLPDYLFTTEIYAEDYIKGGAGDYLLIAK